MKRKKFSRRKEEEKEKLKEERPMTKEKIEEKRKCPLDLESDLLASGNKKNEMTSCLIQLHLK